VEPFARLVCAGARTALARTRAPATPLSRAALPAQHAVAGSIAGLAEHSVMFPVDTVKTMMQARQQQQCALILAVERQGAAGASSAAATACSCARCASPLDLALRLWRTHGGFRLWRGVQTMFTGCIPAHATYFSIYEYLKPTFTTWLMQRARPAVTGGPSESMQAMGAGGAVAVGTMAHDMIMTPMDVCKQRMQLSASRSSVYDCACTIMRDEGPRAFVVSYPTTLLMNLPYALIMGTSNEALRQLLSPEGERTLPAFLAAGAGSGALAAALTNPLDVVKTRLQTQHLSAPPVMPVAGAAAGAASSAGAAAARATGCGAGGAAGGGAARPLNCPKRNLTYRGMVHATQQIWAEEGHRGFLRGVSARMLVHAPSVAICWTAYETIKLTLERADLF